MSDNKGAVESSAYARVQLLVPLPQWKNPRGSPLLPPFAGLHPEPSLDFASVVSHSACNRFTAYNRPLAVLIVQSVSVRRGFSYLPQGFGPVTGTRAKVDLLYSSSHSAPSMPLVDGLADCVPVLIHERWPSSSVPQVGLHLYEMSIISLLRGPLLVRQELENTHEILACTLRRGRGTETPSLR